MRLLLCISLILSGGLLVVGNALVTENGLPAQPDHWLIFRSDRTGYNALYRMRPDGSELARISGPILDNWQDMRPEDRQSPDGQWFYFKAGVSLHAVDTRTWQEHQVIPVYPPSYHHCARWGLDRKCGFVSWTVEGNWMLYTAETANGLALFRASPDGALRQQITAFQWDVFLINHSPDKEWILLENLGDFYTLRGNRIHRLNRANSSRFVTWMADSSALTFIEYDQFRVQKLVHMRPDGSNHREIVIGQPYGHVLDALDDDPQPDEWVYYSEHDQQQQKHVLYRARLDASQVESLNVEGFDPQPVGEWLYYSRYDPDGRALYRYNLRTRTIESVAENADDVNPIAESPDGTWQVFNRCPDDPRNSTPGWCYHSHLNWDSLESVNTVTGKRVMLSDYKRNRFNSVSPDGEWLYFTAVTEEIPFASGSWEVYRVRFDGTGLENLTRSEGDDEMVGQVIPRSPRSRERDPFWNDLVAAVLLGLGGSMGGVHLIQRRFSA